MSELTRSYLRYYISYSRVAADIAKIVSQSRQVTRSAVKGSRSVAEEARLWENTPQCRFRDRISEELVKVNQFAVLKHEEVLTRLRTAVAAIRQAQQNENKDEDDMERELEMLGEEIVHLDHFIRANHRLLLKLGYLFDETLGVTANQWFIANVIHEPFCNVDVDILLVLLSVVWNKLNQEIQEIAAVSGSSSKMWKPPDSFVRSTTKYWVRPENVIRAKVSIVRHLPYLIFGTSMNDLEMLLDPYNVLVRGHCPSSSSGRIEESQPVSSVYFDNEAAYSYQQRIQRVEGAELVRFRWYGDNKGEDDKEIFVERKTHHDSWTGEESAKERFALPQKWAFAFMKGQFTIEEYVSEQQKTTGHTHSRRHDKMLQLGRQIQQKIAEKRLQPMIRTSYLRAAFQAADSNSVRISLDTNLCMVDEYIPDGHPTPPWCRLAEDLLGKNQVVRFPHAVLEVKLQTAQSDWVTQMLGDCGATMLFKFSKYQHGMAYLHRDRMCQLPHWLGEFEPTKASSWTDISAPISTYFSPGMMMEAYGSTTAWSSRRQERTAAELVVGRSRNIRKVDPKSFFAAERTFLHYVQKALYLDSLCVALLTLEGSGLARRVGFVLALGVVCMLLFAYAVYVNRTRRLLRRETGGGWRSQLTGEADERLDSKWGPFIVFVVLSFVVVFAFVLNIEEGKPFVVKKRAPSVDGRHETLTASV